jgi:hypothetical protein
MIRGIFKNMIKVKIQMIKKAYSFTKSEGVPGIPWREHESRSCGKSIEKYGFTTCL